MARTIYTEGVTGSPERLPEGLAGWATKLGLELDEHQEAILDPSIRRGILNCCRKWGKSTMIALKAAHFAAHRPGTTVLVVAPSSRQSEELLGIAARMLRDLEQTATYSQAKITLKNRSRILALPNQAKTIRGYSPELVVIDEAAYLPEEMWETALPMLNAAEGGGWLWLMSTPAEPVGFFHRLWSDEKAKQWTRLKVTAYDCPRIPEAMIAEAKRSFPADRFAREYLCEFAQPSTAAFPEEMVRACVDSTLPDFFTSPLPFPLPAAPRRAQPHAYMGQDLGECVDPSVLAIAEYVSQPTLTVDPATREPLFRCSLTVRHMESPPLGTEYPDVAARARQVAQHPRIAGRCTLVMDANGPGAGAMSLFTKPKFPAPLIAIKATGGQEARPTEGGYNVPKPMLLDRLEYLLRTKKLRIAVASWTEPLIRELTMMKRELQPSGYVTYSSPIHDDMVMALAMAAWVAWKEHERYLDAPGPVTIVSGAGVLEALHVHPLFRSGPVQVMVEPGGRFRF